MDDFVLFSNDREFLVAARERIEEFLSVELELELKNSGNLDRTEAGLGFLGALITGSHVRLMGKSKRRLRRKLKRLVSAFDGGQIGGQELSVRGVALLARTEHAKARGLRARWIADFADADG